jgi:SAM-dependent methyltransferase
MDEDPTAADYWDRRAEAWDHREGVLERFTEDIGRAGIEALDPQPGERLLDIGCGPGATTLDLAGRVGALGEVVGVDISPGMVAAAQRRAAGAGVANARFVVHDVTDAPLPESYDGVFSRFGVMFFPRPEDAFANLGASLRPGGRFAAVVWAGPVDNPWMSVTNLAAAAPLGVELTLPDPTAPGPFSLADPERALALLRTAGLADGAVDAVHARLAMPVDSAPFEVASMLHIGPLGDAFAAAGQEQRAAAVTAVLEAAEAYRVDGGWELPGHALVLRGVRPG